MSRIPSLLICTMTKPSNAIEIGNSLEIGVHTSPIVVVVTRSHACPATRLAMCIVSASTKAIVAIAAAASSISTATTPRPLRRRHTKATAATSSIAAAVVATAASRPVAAASIAEATAPIAEVTSAGVESSPAWVKTLLTSIAVHGVETMQRHQGSSDLTPFPG
jgi:hypothetical protein